MTRDHETRWWRRLKALAELAGDTEQKDIAETLGVSAAAVTRWRQGTPPRAESVVAAAREYGVDATELLQIAYLDEDNKPPKEPRRKKIHLQPRQDMPPY